MNDDATRFADEAARVFRLVAPIDRLRSAPREPRWWADLAADGWTTLGAARARGEVTLDTVVAVYRSAGTQLLIEDMVTSGYVLSYLLEHATAGPARDAYTARLVDHPGVLLGDGRSRTFTLDHPTVGWCFGTGTDRGPVFRLARTAAGGPAIDGADRADATVSTSRVSGLSCGVASVEVTNAPWASLPLGLDREQIDLLGTEAVLVHSAALIGCATRALELVTDHTKGRVQFGVPIAGFQAVKHAIADAHVANEIAWSAVVQAVEAPDDEFGYRCDVARYLTVEAALGSARTSSQFFGGMGFTWDCDLHFYTKAILDGVQRFGGHHQVAGRIARGSIDIGARDVRSRDDTAAEAEFRAEVRAWAEALPPRLHHATDFEELIAVDRLLGAAGLLGVCWPSEYGGRGAPPTFETILMQELAGVGISRTETPSHQGINNLAPALVVHGTDEQKARHLPSTLRVETVWCQGFSETEAGSDLANVRTNAAPTPTGFVVNGSKIWTSGAEHAQWMYALVRTGAVADRHRSLGFLLIPMDSPGITIRPIRQITGESEFSEVFFDDVAVDHAALVGGPRDGWKVAMTLLESERLSGRFRFVTFMGQLERLCADVAAASPGGIDEHVARRLGRVGARLEGMGAIAARIDESRAANRPAGGLPSMNKLWWPQVHQELAELGVELSAELGFDPTYWYRTWLFSRPESIYGGAAQIQRNIIAERHLGMPRLGT